MLEGVFFCEEEKKSWRVKVKWENTKFGEAEIVNQAFMREMKQVR